MGVKRGCLLRQTRTNYIFFERKILGKIYGPTQNPDGAWRIETNDKLRRRMLLDVCVCAKTYLTPDSISITV